jgi:hypothetical protein
MKLLTDDLKRRLLKQGQIRAEGKDTKDVMPLVKLFCAWSAARWLLSELDPDDPDIAFGLCDLGLGFPELGSVSVAELEAIQGPMGLRVERALGWRPQKTLIAYAEEADREQRIIA